MPKTKNKKIDTAKVNDGFLIITLTKSTTPVVWRLELEKAKVAAFEIKTEKEKHALTIKVAKKAIEVIGVFNNNDDAINALLAISDALSDTGTTSKNNPEKETTDTVQNNNKPQKTNNNKTAIVLLSTFIVIGLFYYYWGRLIPTTQVFESQTISSNVNSDPASQTGVPVSADDLLKGF